MNKQVSMYVGTVAKFVCCTLTDNVFCISFGGRPRQAQPNKTLALYIFVCCLRKLSLISYKSTSNLVCVMILFSQL